MGSPQHPQRPPHPQYPPRGPYPQYPPQTPPYPPPPRSFWQRQGDAIMENEIRWPFLYWKIFVPLLLGLAAVLAVAGILVTRAHDALDDNAASAVPANASTPANTVNGAVPWGTIEATLIFVDDSTEKRVFQIVTEDSGTSYRICGNPY